MPHAPHPDFRAKAREIVAAQVAYNAAHPPIGVSWSALTVSRRVKVERVADVAARLRREHDAAQAFRRTPEGRFLAAAMLIYEATGDERLLQCRSRGLDTNADHAMALLDRMEGPAADDARAALTAWMTAKLQADEAGEIARSVAA